MEINSQLEPQYVYFDRNRYWSGIPLQSNQVIFPDIFRRNLKRKVEQFHFILAAVILTLVLLGQLLEPTVRQVEQ
jgi:hypothetical protein